MATKYEIDDQFLDGLIAVLKEAIDKRFAEAEKNRRAEMVMLFNNLFSSEKLKMQRELRTDAHAFIRSITESDRRINDFLASQDKSKGVVRLKPSAKKTTNPVKLKG